MTTKNDELMGLIRSRNRIGIPFTIVYGPGAPGGILLEEIFSSEDLVRAIETAAK
jgi:suppressor for copper-sensitivity B